MPNFYVSYPTAGQVTVCVAAENKADAIERGWDLLDHPEATREWEAMSHITQGSVFCGPLNSVYAEETDDEPFEVTS